MRVAWVMLLVACTYADMLRINDHSWKTYLGDNVTLEVNVTGEKGTWEHPQIYNQGNNTVRPKYWEFKGKRIGCAAIGDLIVPTDCETLSIIGVQEKHGGFYYVFVEVAYPDGSMQEMRILRGLNVNGPRYRDVLKDQYLQNIKVAGISAGSVLGFLMLCALISHFRYSARAERQHGDDDTETAF